MALDGEMENGCKTRGGRQARYMERECRDEVPEEMMRGSEKK